ncbi:Pimaradiene synthase pbcA [Cladobotryum mycophilum]|uniref:Pimaradiene synthase pbcA n=1 Tax=Cladobotryum mycophilum TaxID=491253 RepID=A0ABR0T3N4_9HYPO
MTNATLESRAKRLVQNLASSLNQKYHGSNSMTLCVYDTAWVGMVSKTERRQEDGEMITRWLFPECIEFVLERQSEHGGFGNQRAEVDGILNTMAALLMLCRLRRNASSVTGAPFIPQDLDRRIESARNYLEQALRSWRVESAIHVGFEILVPGMLVMLSKEGLVFHFPGHEALMVMNKRKLKMIPPQLFYSSTKTTLLHSMEAFVGIVDFDKMRHHVINGSLMGSPSSTAAYLMNLGDSGWDDSAEAYLRFVVEAGNGAVPSAFPISVFEITWVMSTLLMSGFNSESLGLEDASKLGDYLEAVLRDNEGITGFAPGILPDADDTAKSILTLNLLGRPTTCEMLIDRFETPTHFKTYDLESNGSFSANCNVLNAILHSENLANHLPQISKALNFLCQAWYDGNSDDKWNLDPQYCMMFLSEVLEHVVKLWDKGTLAGLSSDLVATRVPLVTLQILIRTLSAQSDDGSWRGSAEITAYALLTLKKLANLPWAKLALGSKIQESIIQGTKFLQETNWDQPEFIWVEKVTYGSRILSETYCLAALQASPDDAYNWGDEVSRLCRIPIEKIDKFAKFFGMLPVLSGEPKWRLRASLIEGCMFAPLLRNPKLAIFPKPEKSTYLEYIPFTWTTINNANGFGISTQTMCDMMIISMINFQVDKFLEDVTEDPTLDGGFDSLRSVISRLFDQQGLLGLQTNGKTTNGKHSNGTHTNGASTNGASNGHSNGHSNGNHTNGVNGHPKVNGVKRTRDDSMSELFGSTTDTLTHYLTYVLEETKVSRSSTLLRQRVRDELSIFLQAHVTQGELNARFSKPGPPEKQPKLFKPPNGTYFDWVRTTSANHTSCPYSFEFFRCLISSPGKDCFAGPRAGYISQDLCRHLATLCRQYNDYGSIARDREENNLNSVNFSEFHKSSNGASQPADGAKKTLLDIADYERQCLNLAMDKLKPEVSAATFKALQVFVNVTDLYGQIYVVRDINSNGTKA